MLGVNILIIEDEVRLAEVLSKQLNDAGYTTQVANDGYNGKKLASQNNYNLIILDINLPLINGYDLCIEIRKINSAVPIIMLTALGAPDQKVAGFDVGADDYITKPYNIRELLARINVFLKRSEIHHKSEVLRVADLEINTETKTVIRAGEKIELTAKEYALLEFFVRNKGKILSRDVIINQVWGIDFDPGTNIIDVYVNYLRKKIDKGFDVKLIHTRLGFGFYCDEKEF